MTTDPVAARVDVGKWDLTTPGDLSAYMAALLAALAELPTDPKLAHAVAALVTAQVRITESVTLDARVSALEQSVTLRRGA